MDTNLNLFAAADYDLLLEKYLAFKKNNRIKIINEVHYSEMDKWTNKEIFMIKIIYNPIY